ncbi:NAD(+)/NADH kinase [Gimesia chilikensis]|uniref:NAD(+)/NADH kinase n=1 Tax=Gimesia chilikensis TaxID=2605989 RepID=UPI00119E77B0|nr:NAD(+)/NADH kinase [Gimesia chilikensis]
MSESPLNLMFLLRDQSAHIQTAWDQIHAYLQSQSSVYVSAVSVIEDFTPDDSEADLVVVLGGDGAILRACRQMGLNQLPMIGVNLGRLGFLADLTPDGFCKNFAQIVDRKYRIVEHLMFECKHYVADGSVNTYLGLNEVVISSAGAMSMIDVELTVNNELVTTYSGDGLIISTPVGSTAHSLSAGGPILKQDLQAFVITPICPHTPTNRPLVDNANALYSLSSPNAPEGAMLVIDGQIKVPYASGDRLELKRAPVAFKLARIPGFNYYTRLNRKLGWGGQPKYGAE